LDATAERRDGISKLVGLADPQLASEIITLGGGIVQAGKGIEQIANLAGATGSIFGDLAPVLGVLNPMAGVAGAAVQIFGLFGGGAGTPNPNAAVLAQIQNLSRQIAKLQQDVDAQFAQVNNTLHTILVTLNQNFALINYQLGVLNGDAHAIQVGLLDVQTQLNQLAVYSLAHAQTQEYETLVQYLNGCLNYRTIHNGADIGLPQYNTCENELFTWANNDVTDQLWAGVQQPDYSNTNIYNIFLNSSVTGVCSGCASPFSTDVNYLAQFPAQNPGLGLPALATLRLPNPEMWTLVARAYLQLAKEWPQYTVTINSVHFDNLIQVGTSLQQAIHKANSTGSGGSIVTNQPLFNAVVNKYNAAVNNLQSAIQSDVNSFVSDPSNRLANPSNPSQTLNLWGAPTQPSTSYVPSALNTATSTSIPGCPGDPNTYAKPPNLVSLLPSVVINASQLFDTPNAGVIGICMASSNVWAGDAIDFPYRLLSYQIQLTTSSGTILSHTIYVVAQGAQFLSSGTPDCRGSIWNLGYCIDPLAIPSDNHLHYLTITPTPIDQCCGNSDTCQTLGSSLNYFFFPSHIDAEFLQFINQHSGLYLCGEYTTQTYNLANLFAGNSVTISSPTSQQLAAFSGSITSLFQKDQQTLYATISTDLKSGSAVPAAHFLSGTKLLAQAYANFGLPSYLQTSSSLQGVLYGNGSIPDAAAVQSDFAGFATTLVSDITDNKITDEIAMLNSRSTALAAAFTGARSQIQQSGVPDSLAQVDTTLADLQAFETLKNASAISACTYQVSSSAGTIDLAGGSVTLTVSSANGCSLAPTTGASWLAVNMKSEGSGQFLVTITATPDINGSPRSGVVIVGDQIFRAFQGTVNSTTSPLTYAVTSQIKLNGAGVPGVTVTLGGSQTVSSITDLSGNYSFGDLAPGANGSIVPSLAGYIFNPSSSSFSSLSANMVVDFTATTNSGSVPGPIFSNPQVLPTSFSGGAITIETTVTNDANITSVKAIITLPDNSVTTVNLTEQSGSLTAGTWSGTFNIPSDFNQVGQTYQIVITATDSSQRTTSSSSAPLVIAPPTATTPELFVTSVPSFGSSEPIQGKTANVVASNYSIALAIFVPGLGWYSKPSCTSLLTALNSDGTWSVPYATGGVDSSATKLAVYLVPRDFTFTCVAAGSALPTTLDQAAVARFIVERQNPNEKIISFAGYNWAVKANSVPLGPGPNMFSDSADNVSVDSSGILHLKVTNTNGTWQSAEVISKQTFGWGTYTFDVLSDPSTLDPNAVTGLFTWSEDAAYSNRERDIEFSKFGVANNATNAQFTVQPYQSPGHLQRFTVPHGLTESTYRIQWTPTGVDFLAFPNNDANLSTPFYQWMFSSTEPRPAPDQSLHFNLWLFNGLAPTSGSSVELLLKDLQYGAASGSFSTMSLSSTSISFATQRVGSTSASQSIQLTNSGNNSITITGIASGGSNPGDFSQVGCSPFPYQLAPNSGCSLAITFTPTSRGSRSALISINDNAKPSAQTITVSGNGCQLSSAPPLSLHWNQQIIFTILIVLICQTLIIVAFTGPRRRRLSLCVALIFASLCLLQVSCGGGSSSGTAPSGGTTQTCN